MQGRSLEAHPRRGLLREQAPAYFPGARAETLADAPPRCICGAPWLAEDGGLACRICGRRLYVTGELRRFIQRYGF